MGMMKHILKFRRPFNPEFPRHTGFTREDLPGGVTKFSDFDPRRPQDIKKVTLDPKDYAAVAANDILLEN